MGGGGTLFLPKHIPPLSSLSTSIWPAFLLSLGRKRSEKRIGPSPLPLIRCVLFEGKAAAGRQISSWPSLNVPSIGPTNPSKQKANGPMEYIEGGIDSVRSPDGEQL